MLGEQITNPLQSNPLFFGMKRSMNNFVCVSKKVARLSRYCVGAVIGLSSMAALSQDNVSVGTEDAKKTVISVSK